MPERKTLKIVIGTIFLILIQSCTTNNADRENWEKIKNSSDFITYFNFAISLNDTCLLSECIDSIEKHKPTKGDAFYLKFISETDSNSLTNEKFILVDFEKSYRSDPIIRNFLVVKIDKYDSVQTFYLDEKCHGYNQKLIEIYNSNDISKRFPTSEKLSYRNNEYIQRNLCVFLNTNIFPISSLYSDKDTLTSKTSWRKLITVTKDLLSTIKLIKNKKSNSIFHTEYHNLKNEEKKFIDTLITTNIEILLIDLSELKPPPPPISYGDFDKINCKKKTGANTRLCPLAG